MKLQRGGFAIGLVAGLLVGLALALGVALYITKAPVPFIDKVPQRTAEQDSAEAERNRTWNPNAPLAPNIASQPSQVPLAATPALPPAGPSAAARDPAAILSGTPATAAVSTASAPSAFSFLVQVGAYTRQEDAEAQRARLAMQGLSARISERQQAGRTAYRVRLGPFDDRADAEAMQQRLRGEGMETQLVRVTRP